MKIAVNCHSFLKKYPTGIGRYTYNLLKNLAEIDQQNQYLLYVKRGLFEFNKNIPIFKADNFSLKVDYFKQGPHRLLKEIDIYHSPSPDYIHFDSNTKVIVTVHDVIFKAFPESHTSEAIEQTEKQFGTFLNKAAKIICCSQSTINDLVKFFGVSKERLALIYQGVDKSIFYPLGTQEEEAALGTLKIKGIERPFILFVGTIEPRKNLENILRALKKLRLSKEFLGKLVIIGNRGWMSEGIDALVEELDLKEAVIFLGHVSDQELRYFYNKTEVFVFPSFYEGFGFPIVEAFSCGAAVVTSNVSSCAELAADAALTVEPNDSEDIAKAISRIIHDTDLKKNLREKALRRSQDFSFRKTAQETLRVYEEVTQS